ncbi:hypothetical protein [Flindersiella endophytica]
MTDDPIKYHAGTDAYGLALWVDGRVVEREQRNDGEWLYVLPAGAADADPAGQWVRGADTRPAARR